MGSKEERKALGEIIADMKMKMDKVMVKYRDNKHPPVILEDQNEIIAILAGMGRVAFENRDGLCHIVSKSPCSIAWDGDKFIVYEQA